MAYGYLFPAILVGVCTSCALWPYRGWSVRGRLSYHLGWMVNELPFMAIYFLTASTLLAFAQGDVDSFSGRVAFGLCLVDLVGLAAVAWQAPQAREALDQGLTDGLGEGWRAQVKPGLATDRGLRLPLGHALVNPFRRRRRDVERIADLPYGDAGPGNLLDVYRHRSRPGMSPVLVHLHGGTFVSGRKDRESLPLLYRLASQGWLCISADYRLGPDASFPAQLVDAKRVLAWVRSHGVEYGADPAFVLVAGDSAGAHIAATAALTQNERRYQPGFEDADTTVSGAVLLYGYYGRSRSEDPDSSPLAHADAAAPPVFVIHGSRDSLVPAAAARQFVARLRRASQAPVVYAELPGAQHTFDFFRSIRSDLAVDRIEAFAGWARSRVQPMGSEIRPGDARRSPDSRESFERAS